jgi:hypothetical protein
VSKVHSWQYERKVSSPNLRSLFFLFSSMGWECLWTASPRHISVERHGGMILTAETEELWETCPIVTLSTTPRWTDPGANPGRCCERLATNRLSHITAKDVVTSLFVRFQVLTTMNMNVAVLWCFRGAHCLHRPDWGSNLWNVGKFLSGFSS